MKVVGIDLSISRTGIGVITEGRTVATSLKVDALTANATYAERYKRLEYAADWVETCLLGDQPLMIVLESMLLASNSPGTFERAGLWWIVLGVCLRMCPSVALVHPKTRANWATGSGAADKDAVKAAVELMYPTVAKNHDEADALVLASMGSQWLKLSAVEASKDQKRALHGRGCKWPATPAEVLARYANRPR